MRIRIIRIPDQYKYGGKINASKWKHANGGTLSNFRSRVAQEWADNYFYPSYENLYPTELADSIMSNTSGYVNNRILNNYRTAVKNSQSYLDLRNKGVYGITKDNAPYFEGFNADRARELGQYADELGLSDAQKAVLIDTAYRESKINPNSSRKVPGKYKGKKYLTTVHGMYQFTDSNHPKYPSDTLTRYRKWLKEKGKEDSMKTQTEWFLNHYAPERRDYSTWTNPNSTIEELSDYMIEDVESPLNIDEEFLNKHRNAAKAIFNRRALGGSINTHGGVFDNGVTIIGNGGTHEENPLEGVQMGVDEQGIPNLVEEGEVIFNDYVFSKRIKAPKDMKKQYKFKGNTFADVAKNIQKESEERPNDPISQAGLEANMARLAMSQEVERNKSKGNNKRRNKNRFDWGGDISSLLRYAPIVGQGITTLTDIIGSSNDNDYSNIDLIGNVANNLSTVSYSPIGNYLTYKPFDRNYYINKLNAQSGATRRAIENMSGGNRATKIAGLLAADYNAQGRLGDLARQAEEYNLAQRQRVEDFNRATNMFNSQSAMRAAQINKQNDELRLKAAITEAQLRDKIDSELSAARSSNLTNFWNNLGELGRESYTMNMLNSNPALLYSLSGLGDVTYKRKKKSKGGFLTIKKK